MKVEILNKQTVKSIAREIFRKEAEPLFKHIDILRQKILGFEEEIKVNESELKAHFVEDDILARNSLKGKYSPSDTREGGLDSQMNPPNPLNKIKRRSNGSNNNRN